MATCFIVCLVLVSYSAAAATSTSFSPLHLPAANSSFPVPNGTYISYAEIAIERPDDTSTSSIAIGSKTGGQSNSTTPEMKPMSRAATYDENVTSSANNGANSLLSPVFAITLLYLILVAAIILYVYRQGGMTLNGNVLVLYFLFYAFTIWVLTLNGVP